MDHSQSLWPRLGGAPLDEAADELAPDASHRVAGDGSLRVELISDPAKLAAYVPAWEELCASAAEPNIFLEPWMLLPALEQFGPGQRISVALILDGAGSSQRIIGLVPLQRRRTFRRLPVPTVGVWCHCHCYLTTPLLRKDEELAAWKTLFEFLARWRKGGAIFDIDTLAADGPVARALVDYLQQSRCPTHVAGVYNRALLIPGPDASTYVHRTLSRDLRRRLARKRRRLEERGEVTLRTLGPDDDIEVWLDQFVRLEASGWKGRAGTAVEQQPAELGFFRGTTRRAHEMGRLLMLSLCVDGQPIAMQVNMSSGDGGFALKCAYDEDWGIYSPGTLLELEAIHILHQRPNLQWVDSCSSSANTLMRRLWGEKRTILHLVLPTGRPFSRLLISLIPIGSYLRHGLRTLLRMRSPGQEEEYL
jgi:CelD/BcsL family acetyltransferase involved in cellulose biosynthesis